MCYPLICYNFTQRKVAQSSNSDIFDELKGSDCNPVNREIMSQLKQVRATDSKL